MNIREAIRLRLVLDPEVSALAGERIRVGKLEQRDSRPAVRIELVGADREQSHGGPSRLVTSSFTIDCVGDTALQAAQMAEAVVLALDGETGDWGEVEVHRCHCTGERDEYLDDVRTHLVVLDFEVQHRGV